MPDPPFLCSLPVTAQGVLMEFAGKVGSRVYSAWYKRNMYTHTLTLLTHARIYIHIYIYVNRRGERVLRTGFGENWVL